MNHVSKCWVYCSNRAIVKQQKIMEYMYAYTMICPLTGETYSIISTYCNTEAKNLLLFETDQYYNYYRIVMIMDSTGWHPTKKLERPENIIVVPLPPFSPQLNPVEHIWDYIKEQKEFNNHSFNSLNDVEMHLCKVF